MGDSQGQLSVEADARFVAIVAGELWGRVCRYAPGPLAVPGERDRSVPQGDNGVSAPQNREPWSRHPASSLCNAYSEDCRLERGLDFFPFREGRVS